MIRRSTRWKARAVTLPVASLVLLAACASGPHGVGASVAAAVEATAACHKSFTAQGRLSLQTGGDRRHFHVRLPATYTGTAPHPLIVAFHGFGYPALLLEKTMTFAPEWPEAIVVYPRGLPRELPIYPGMSAEGWQISPGELGDRDVEFFDALLSWLSSRYCVDRSRVYVAGASNGAYFAQLVACLRPDAVAAVAVSAGGLRCEPRGPVPVLLTHGRVDRTVPFSEALSAQAAWASRNGCRGVSEPTADGCQARRDCENGEVVLCPHDHAHDFYDPAFNAKAVAHFRRHRRGASR